MTIKLKMLTKQNDQNENDQHLSDQFKVIQIKVIKTKQSVQDPILVWSIFIFSSNRLIKASTK